MNDTTSLTVERCVVGDCEYNPENGKQAPELDDTIKFYNFPARATRVRPADRLQRVKFIEFVRVSRGHDPKSPSSWTPSPNDKICSNHFVRNCKSEHPNKSNFAPTIFPENLRSVPPRIIYDLRDLVCWWIKEGETQFPQMLPIVEADPLPPSIPPKKPKPNDKQQQHPPRTIKSLTLIEMDVSSEPNPFVKTYIRVNKDLTFKACMKNTPVPAHAVLGESEKICQIGSVYEFQTALDRLMNLNLCIGISTAGINKFPPEMNGRVEKIFVDGKETERLVSNDCEVVAGIKVCAECKKLWNKYNGVYKYAQYARKKVEVDEEEEEEEESEGEQLTVEQRLTKCERVIENYKAEVCKLLGQNQELKDRVLILKEALRQEEGEKIVDRRRKFAPPERSGGGGGDSDVEVVDEVSSGGKKPRMEADSIPDEDGVSEHVSVGIASPAPAPQNKPLTTTPRILKQPQKVTPKAATTPHQPNTPSQPIKTAAPPQPTSTTSQQNPTRKVLKITPEQALLLRKYTATNASGNVIRVQASQIASINKILGRTTTPPGSPQPPQPSTSAVQKTQVPPTTTTTQKQVIRIVDNRKACSADGGGNKETPDGGGEEPTKKVITVFKVE